MVHMSKSHNVNKYYCGYCDKGFLFKNLYQIHQSVVHNVNPRYQCEQCGRSFPFKNHEYKMHILSHTNHKGTEGLYMCNQCDMEFSQSINLESHMRTHTSEKPYHCTQCESFTLYHSFIGHTTEHTKEDSDHCKLKEPNISEISNKNYISKRKVFLENEKIVHETNRDIPDCSSEPNIQVKIGKINPGWSGLDTSNQPILVKEEQFQGNIGVIEDHNESKIMIKEEQILIESWFPIKGYIFKVQRMWAAFYGFYKTEALILSS